MQPFCSLHITAVGDFVAESLQENKLILFSNTAPTELAHYCAIHESTPCQKELAPGQTIEINDTAYVVTAVGDVATQNFKQLGHITLSFDNADSAELPGTVHLRGPTPTVITAGDNIIFINSEFRIFND
ncbi:PTS fructose transporter subunit IIA [Pantoea ananatis]|jgi:PTS system glucitol/sorbitol-specific IIA component|uniref:PTS glucitol/sorbitol transporter subunit IIA n=1 Tax=Pantoea ananas TaxID=553 RepID=UPI0007371ED2|nr:PTS glucitol/sorbitol transporter subunit IIA [Pantoea ananatis]KTR48694.1 PTS fructose transporter subunit IIA [Pantoea ananatis]KTR52309.1 PTS fructose transporter subunit IIA [Pantoea ananatis]KTR63090.1 PTS fructose transporter subunit IIA [Pantoea ananatis]KTR67804.1 PTS fructose transporter subunit IIA [Pantoea ananatis]MCW0350783.1 PTS system glucitol/sorbitol-specific EIIA component [Pantoea ananatis]